MITLLFLGFLALNPLREGELTAGQEGVRITVRHRERIEHLINRILGIKDDSDVTSGKAPKKEEEVPSYVRRSLVHHLAYIVDIQKPSDDLGSEIVNAAVNRKGPFNWNYEAAEVRYDPSIEGPVFYVCKDDRDLAGKMLAGSEINVQIKVAGKLTEDGKQLAALGRNCTEGSEGKHIVYTGIKVLADAANMPGSLARVRRVVTIP